MMKFDIEEFKSNPTRKIGLVIYGSNDDKPFEITEAQTSLGGSIVIDISHIEECREHYRIANEDGTVRVNSADYGKLVFLHKKITIHDFAEKLFILQVGKTVNYTFDEERGPEWGAHKMHLFDSDQIAVGSYGGTESGMFPLEGERDSVQLLEFLKCIMEDHLGDFIYIDYD